MSSKERQILRIEQNRITLPNHLISKGVRMFEYEVREDGTIVLTPLSSASKPPHDSGNTDAHLNKDVGHGKIIHFQTGRAIRQKHLQQKKMGQKHIYSDQKTGNKERFVKLHLFRSRLEAEMAGEILKQSHIPFLIQSEDIGIFGPGASPAPGGARLVVRRTDLLEAKQVLAGLI